MAIAINLKSIDVGSTTNVLLSMTMDNTTVPPRIIVNDQEVLDNGKRIEGSRQLIEEFVPTHTIPLINPETGEVVGDFTHGEIYAVIFSVYKHMVDEQELKDNSVEVDPEVDDSPPA